jgi:SAM-dependent methyltransferase
MPSLSPFNAMASTLYDDFARIYDLQHSAFSDDIPLYLKLARELSPESSILELGCGTGRVMRPLAANGHRVVGVDESAEMLEIARQHLGGSAQLIQADNRAFALEERFELVIIALNTFLHNLTVDDQLATLRVACAHLTSTGRLVIDLPPNDEMAFQPDDGEFELETTLIDADAGARINKYVASRLFWATQEQELTYRIEEERGGATRQQRVQFRLRHVFRHELDLMLKLSGFAGTVWYGDYQQHPYVDGSPRMICVTQRALT